MPAYVFSARVSGFAEASEVNTKWTKQVTILNCMTDEFAYDSANIIFSSQIPAADTLYAVVGAGFI